MKFYSPCCGQCKVVAMEFKKNPIILLLNDKEEVVETWHGIIKSEVINNKIKEYEAN